MPDLELEMQKAAAYAVQMARERFGVTLSGSPDDLNALEQLIQQAQRQLDAWAAAGKDIAPARLQTARIWGSFLGEYLRQKWGGEWQTQGSGRVLHIHGQALDPIGYVAQRLSNAAAPGSVSQYIEQSARRLAPRPAPGTVRPTQPPAAPARAGNPKPPRNPLVLAIGGLSVVLIVLLALIIPRLLNRQPVSGPLPEQTGSTPSPEQTEAARPTAVPRLYTDDLLSYLPESIGPYEMSEYTQDLIAAQEDSGKVLYIRFGRRGGRSPSNGEASGLQVMIYQFQNMAAAEKMYNAFLDNAKADPEKISWEPYTFKKAPQIEKAFTSLDLSNEAEAARIYVFKAQNLVVSVTGFADWLALDGQSPPESFVENLDATTLEIAEAVIDKIPK